MNKQIKKLLPSKPLKHSTSKSTILSKIQSISHLIPTKTIRDEPLQTIKENPTSPEPKPTQRKLLSKYNPSKNTFNFFSSAGTKKKKAFTYSSSTLSLFNPLIFPSQTSNNAHQYSNSHVTTIYNKNNHSRSQSKGRTKSLIFITKTLYKPIKRIQKISLNKKQLNHRNNMNKYNTHSVNNHNNNNNQIYSSLTLTSSTHNSTSEMCFQGHHHHCNIKNKQPKRNVSNDIIMKRHKHKQMAKERSNSYGNTNTLLLHSNNNNNEQHISSLIHNTKSNVNININYTSNTTTNANIKTIINKDDNMNEQIPDEGIIPKYPRAIQYTKQIYTNNYLSLCFHSIFNFKQSITNLLCSFLTGNDLYALCQVNKKFNEYTSTQIALKTKHNIIHNRSISLKLWEALLFPQSSITNVELHTTYNTYMNAHSLYKEQIIKDLKRTQPNNKATLTLTKLQNVLNAYASFNTQIGYAQGMNFITAKLFHKYETEATVFHALDALICLLNFKQVIGIHHEIAKHLSSAGKAIERNVPRLFAYLNRNGINHEIFTANWIITLFSTALDDDVLYLVWDFIVIYKWKFIYCFIAGVLKVYEDDIMKVNVFEFSKVMKQLLKRNEVKRDIYRIINVTFAFMFGINDDVEECERYISKSYMTTINNNVNTFKDEDDVVVLDNSE